MNHDDLSTEYDVACVCKMSGALVFIRAEENSPKEAMQDVEENFPPFRACFACRPDDLPEYSRLENRYSIGCLSYDVAIADITVLPAFFILDFFEESQEKQKFTVLCSDGSESHFEITGLPAESKEQAAEIAAHIFGGEALSVKEEEAPIT